MANEYTGYSREQRRFQRHDIEPPLKRPAVSMAFAKHRRELDELYTIPNDPYTSWRFKRNAIRREVRSNHPDATDSELELIYDQYNLGQDANPKDFSRDRDFGGTVSRVGSMWANIGEGLWESGNFFIAKHLTGDPHEMIESHEELEEIAYENALIQAYQSKDMNPVTQFLFDLTVSAPVMAGVMIGGTAVGGAAKGVAAAAGVGAVASWIAGLLGFNAVEALIEAGFNYTDVISDPMVVKKIEEALGEKMTGKSAEEIRLRALEILGDRADDSAETVFYANFFNPLNMGHTFGAGRLSKLIKVASGKWGTAGRIAAKVSAREALEEALQSAGSQYTAHEAKMLALKDVGAQLSFPLREGTIYGIDPKQVAYEALMGGFVGAPLGYVQGYRGYTKWQKGAFDLDKNGNPVRQGDPVGRLFSNVPDPITKQPAQPGDYANFIPKGLILNQVRSIISIPDTESALISLDEYRQRAADQDQRIVNIIDEEINNMRQGADLLGEKTIPKRTTDRQQRANRFRPGTHATVDPDVDTDVTTPTEEVVPEGATIVADLNADPVLKANVNRILKTPEDQRMPRDRAYLDLAKTNKELDNKQVNDVIKNMEKGGVLAKGGEPVAVPTTEAVPEVTDLDLESAEAEAAALLGGSVEVDYGEVEGVKLIREKDTPAGKVRMYQGGDPEGDAHKSYRLDDNTLYQHRYNESDGFNESDIPAPILGQIKTFEAEYLEKEAESDRQRGQALRDREAKAAKQETKTTKQDTKTTKQEAASQLFDREAKKESKRAERKAKEDTDLEFGTATDTLTIGESATEITNLVKSWSLAAGDSEGAFAWSKIRGELYNKIVQAAEADPVVKKTKYSYTTQGGKKKSDYQIPVSMRDELASGLALELEIMVPMEISREPSHYFTPTTSRFTPKKAPTKKTRTKIVDDFVDKTETKEGVTQEDVDQLEEELRAEGFERTSKIEGTFEPIYKNTTLFDRDGVSIGSLMNVTKSAAFRDHVKTLKGKVVIHYQQNSGFRNENKGSFPKKKTHWRFDGINYDGSVIFTKPNQSAWKLGETVKGSKVIREHAVNKRTGKHTKAAEEMFIHLISGRADTYSGKKPYGKFKNGYLTEGMESDTPLNVAEGEERVGKKERPATVEDVDEQVHTDSLTEGIVGGRRKKQFLSPEQATDVGLAEEAEGKKRTKQEQMKDELAARRKTKREKAKAKREKAKAKAKTKEKTKTPATPPVTEEVAAKPAEDIRPITITEVIANEKNPGTYPRPLMNDIAKGNVTRPQGSPVITESEVYDNLPERYRDSQYEEDSGTQISKEGTDEQYIGWWNRLVGNEDQTLTGPMFGNERYRDVSTWNATGQDTGYFAQQIKNDINDEAPSEAQKDATIAPKKLMDLIRRRMTEWLVATADPNTIEAVKDRYFPILTQKQRGEVNRAVGRMGGATVDTGVKTRKYTAEEQKVRDEITKVREKAKKRREELKKKPPASEEVAPEAAATTEPTLTKDAVKATKKVAYKKPKTPNVWQILTSEVEQIFSPFLSVKQQKELDTFIQSLGTDDAFIVSGGLATDAEWKIFRLDTDIDVAKEDSVARYESGSVLLTSLNPEGQTVPPFIKLILTEHGRMLGTDRETNKFRSRKLDHTDLIESSEGSPSLPSDILARIDRDVDVDLTELEETVKGMPIVWAFNTGKLVELQYMEAAGKGLEPETVQVEFKDEATAARYTEAIKSKNPDRKRLQQLDDELIEQHTKENNDRDAFGQPPIRLPTGIVIQNAQDWVELHGEPTSDTDVDTSTDYYDEIEAAKGKERVYTPEERAEFERKLKDKIRDGSAIPILAPVSEEAPVEVELERAEPDTIPFLLLTEQLTEEEVLTTWKKIGEEIEKDIKELKAGFQSAVDSGNKTLIDEAGRIAQQHGIDIDPKEVLAAEDAWKGLRAFEFIRRTKLPVELLEATIGLDSKGIEPLSNEWWDAIIKRQAEIGHGWVSTPEESGVDAEIRSEETGKPTVQKKRVKPKPIPLPRMKEIVQNFLTMYPGAPPVVIVPDGMMGNLPLAGFYNMESSTTYLNHSELASEALLVKTLWHESVGHGAIHNLLPEPAKAELVQLIKNSFPDDFDAYNKGGQYGDAQKALFHKTELMIFMRKSPQYRKYIQGELRKRTDNTPEETEFIELILNGTERDFQTGFTSPHMPQAHVDFLGQLDALDLNNQTSYSKIKGFAGGHFKRIDIGRGARTKREKELGQGYKGESKRYFLFDVEHSKLIKATDNFAETQVSLEIVARIAESLGHPERFRGGKYQEQATAHYAADPTLVDKIVFWFRKVFANFLESLGYKQKTITLGEVKLGLLELASHWKKEGRRPFRNLSKAATKETPPVIRIAEEGEEAIGSSFDAFYASELTLNHMLTIESMVEHRTTLGDSLKMLMPAHKVLMPAHEKFKNMGDIGAAQLGAMEAMYPSYDPKETTTTSWWSRFKARAFHDVVDPHAVVKEKVGIVPYMKQRLANREDGVMAVMLRHGLVKVKQTLSDGIKINETHFDEKGKGLFNLLRPFGGMKSEVDRFIAWVAYKRADILEKQIGEEDLGILRRNIDLAIDPVSGFNTGDMKDATTGVMTSRKIVYERVAKDLAAWNKNVVDLGIKMGLFNEESASNWNTDWYLPFFRHFEDEIGKDVPKGTRNYKSLAGQTGIKQLKGSKRALDNPLDNLVRNALHIVSASLKNDSAVLTLSQAEQIKDPITGEFLAQRTKHPGASSLRVIKDGKDVHYNISNQLLYDSLASLNVSNDFAGLSWAIGAKNLFTRITTASPLFKKRNILRDTIQAAAFSDVGFNVFKNATGGWKEVGKSEAELLVSGAYIQFGNLRSDDPNYSQKLLTKDMRAGFIGMNPEAHDGFMNAVRKYRQAARSVWDRYQKWGDKAENANRASIYRNLMNKGEGQTKAAYEAKDLHDFTLHGGARWVNLITSITPFANAMLQGKYKAGRQLINNPKPVIIVGSAILLATLAEYFMYEDNEEWQRRQDWDKDMFWWINIPGTDVHFRMPKPHELNIVSNLAWRGLDMARKKDPVHGELFVSAIKSVVSREFGVGGPFPKLISPFIEVGFNENFFFDRPIEPYRFKNMTAKEKRDLYTSETMIRMSEAFDWAGVEVSPMQLSHLVNGYFGWVGEQVIAASDFFVSKDKDFPARPASKILEHNLLRKMFQASPIRNTKAGTAFYDRMTEIEQAYNDMQLSKKLQDWDRYKEIYEEKKDLLKWRDFMKKKQRTFNELNKRIRVIRFDRSMSPENKRLKIDQLYAMRNQIMDRIAESPALR